MKKFLLLISFLAIFSCEKNNPSVLTNLDNDISVNSNKVSISEVNKYVKAKYGKSNTKSQLTVRAIKYLNDTTIFVVNHAEGWELLAADRRYSPILAKGQGYFNYQENNPARATWLANESECIYNMLNNTEFKDTSISNNFWGYIQLSNKSLMTKVEGDPIEDNKYWELIEIEDYDYSTKSKGHLIQTKWDQTDPWNQYVYIDPETAIPCPAGCVALSASQMLYFLHHRLNKPLSISPLFAFDNNIKHFREYNSTLSFSNMALDISNSNINSRKKVAALISTLGYMLNTNYNADGSSSATYRIKNVYKTNFNINSSYDNYSRSTVLNQIYNNMPVIVKATTGTGVFSEGHSWIIDGSVTETLTQRYTYKWTSKRYNDLYEYGETKQEFVTNSTTYLLMNWGWGGLSDNSWYSLNGYWTDNEGDVYSSNIKILYDFK